MHNAPSREGATSRTAAREGPKKVRQGQAWVVVARARRGCQETGREGKSGDNACVRSELRNRRSTVSVHSGLGGALPTNRANLGTDSSRKPEGKTQMGATFEDFWSIYPRKVCKADAKKAWTRMTPEQQFAAIQALPVHIRYWAVAGRSKEYMPHASTWLHGERWEDELEMPQAEESAQWWKTTSGIEAKARAVGVAPRAGEDWHSLKARILAKERAA